MVLNKYAAALLQIGIIVIGAFTLIPAKQFGYEAADGLAVLTAQSVITYLVPLVNKAWAGGLKTGLSALIALLTVIVPWIGQGALTPVQMGIAALAVLNTLAAELGVQIRLDTSKVGARSIASVASNLPQDDGINNVG